MFHRIDGSACERVYIYLVSTCLLIDLMYISCIYVCSLPGKRAAKVQIIVHSNIHINMHVGESEKHYLIVICSHNRDPLRIINAIFKLFFFNRFVFLLYNLIQQTPIFVIILKLTCRRRHLPTRWSYTRFQRCTRAQYCPTLSRRKSFMVGCALVLSIYNSDWLRVVSIIRASRVGGGIIH